MRPGPFAVAALLFLIAAPACTEEPVVEATVPAERGATQPEPSGGLISEDEACDRLSEAFDTASTRLNCKLPQQASCPEFIRPAGSDCADYEYREGTVDACVGEYADYESCDDFAARFCVVVAVGGADGCAQSGAGGADGTGGSAGSGGGGTGGSAGGAAGNGG
jgi:hypothetical protein